MKKGNIIIAGIIGTVMLAGCGVGDPSDNGISIVAEESSVEAQENTTVGAESSDVVSEDSTDSSSEDTAKTSAVDMKDYSEELTDRKSVV